MLSLRRRGFTLIELMITLAVFGVLAALSVPSLTDWMANTRVRSVAETLQNGLRQAQTEAVTRSRQVAFVLTAASPALSATPSATGTSWYVQALPLNESDETTGTYVQGDSTARQQLVSISGVAALCFNSVGRLVAHAKAVGDANCELPASGIVTYAVTATRADRPLNVQVYPGGRVRMCDPSKTLSKDNPDGCV